MIKRLGLYFDHFLNRDKYLANLSNRILYFKDIDSSVSERVIDGCTENNVSNDFRVPEVDVSEFTLDFLKKSMRENGCLIVRNFFNTDEVTEMKNLVDHSFELNSNPESFVNRHLPKRLDLAPVLKVTREAIKEKQKVNPTYANTARLESKLNQRIAAKKSFLTVQVPALAERLLRLFDKKDLKPLLKNYFGNDPCLSVHKWVFRRSTSPDNPIDFHQDGAFMGDEISSLNTWIPLSDCGAGYDVHGLDIVPMRLMSAFRKGSGVLDWTISESAVVETYSEKAIVTPTFRAGDLFFFDHLMVHRSQSIVNSSKPRYAIETWFFDSVNFPKNQMPIKW